MGVAAMKGERFRATGWSAWSCVWLLLVVALAMLSACASATSGTSPRKVQPAPAGAPRIVLGELDAKIILGDLPARALKLGAGPLAMLSAGEQVEGERIGGFFEAPENACLLAYARGSTTIDDLDVVAFAEEGNPIAADQAPDAHPTILVCPPHPGRMYIAAHVANGEGLVGIGAHIVPVARAAEIGRAFGARGSHGDGTRAAEAWPGLDDRLRTHRQAVGGTWEDFRRVAVRVDSRSQANVAFPVEANQCIHVVVVPDEDVALLEVEALDDAGRVVARAHEGLKEPNFVLCSPVAFEGVLTVRPHVGNGLAAVVLARTKGEGAREFSGRASVVWTASPLSLDLARTARNAELTRAGYAAPTSTRNGQLVLGRRLTVPLDLPPQTGGPSACARVDVVGGAPLALVEANIWAAPSASAPSASSSDSGGALLASGEGTGSTTLFVCGRTKAQIELETRGRPGPFSVLVRPERWQNALFAAHPLAATRMLARAAVGESLVHEGVVAGVKHVTLDPARRVTYAMTAGPGQCVRIAVGIDGEGSGVELRLFDAATSEELDRAAGEKGVSARACAPPSSPRSLRIEMRGTAGKPEAIVGERIR
ncbi:hypothetical protein [Pendulispora albinea]|uniref:Uncharacterized protein n=1 Tax=Pendulispora albinea TaxID=2741071 RepID=A0ABZ2M415_9BACT